MRGPESEWPDGNAFEPVLRKRAPRVDAALQALSRFGRARLTGTGGGCFVAFEQREAAEAAAATLGRQWPVWLAGGCDRSPLHRCDAFVARPALSRERQA